MLHCSDFPVEPIAFLNYKMRVEMIRWIADTKNAADLFTTSTVSAMLPFNLTTNLKHFV